MHLRTSTGVLFAMALLAASGCSRHSSPAAPGSQLTSRSIVAGTVQAAGGGAIADASLTLAEDPATGPTAAGRGATPASAGHHVLEATTDANGRYAFEAAFAGAYVLTAGAEGFQPATSSLTIPETGEPNALDTMTVNVTLFPVPPAPAP